jgi:hypothetical protein
MARRKKVNEPGNGKNLTALLYTIVLIAAAIGIIALSSMLLPNVGMMMRGGEMRGKLFYSAESEIAALENNIFLRITISALNVAIVIYLLYIHIKDYLELKTNFTLGIIAMLFSFLLYALTSFPLIRLSMGMFGLASSLSFVPMLFSAIGLLIFAKLSNE